MVYKNVDFVAVGFSYHNSKPEIVNDGKITIGKSSNKKFPDAIEILVDNVFVGHVSKEDIDYVKPFLLSKKYEINVIAVYNKIAKLTLINKCKDTVLSQLNLKLKQLESKVIEIKKEISNTKDEIKTLEDNSSESDSESDDEKPKKIVKKPIEKNKKSDSESSEDENPIKKVVKKTNKK